MPELQGLPLFQLGLVLFPRERLPLHIFEPRYRAMVKDCLQDERPFGILLYQDGKMATVGCTARIQRILQEYEDGRRDILVEGERRFRVEALFQEKAYLTANVRMIEEEDEPVENDLRERLITQHMKLVELAERTLQPNQYQNLDHISYFLAHNAGLSLKQKQALLELPTENQRIAFLVEHLESFIPQVEQVEELRRKVRSNGHMRDAT